MNIRQVRDFVHTTETTYQSLPILTKGARLAMKFLSFLLYRRRCMCTHSPNVPDERGTRVVPCSCWYSLRSSNRSSQDFVLGLATIHWKPIESIRCCVCEEKVLAKGKKESQELVILFVLKSPRWANKGTTRLQ